MSLVQAAVIIMLFSSFFVMLTSQSLKLTNGVGVTGAVLGSVLGLTGAVAKLIAPMQSTDVKLAWSVPFGSLNMGLDSLSAFFLIPIFLLTLLTAIYGADYLWTSNLKKRMARHWFFFNLLAASMVLVVIARNGVFFLIVWEMMALSSYFLVTIEHEQATVRRAGLIYLISTHLGTAVLFIFFILLGSKSGSLEFDQFSASSTQIQPHALSFLVLALIGFGAKAGIIPLHVWLPEAHPAAPSHVSALMSGVMIKTGIYGIIRTLTWLGSPSISWAMVLIGIGCVTGIVGVIMALSQLNLKRLLAYSSVENIGIIFLGLGLGVLGQAIRVPELIILGYGGAFLHIFNHSIFKGLMFLGAGSVLHGVGTLEMSRMGGLMRRMPWTGLAFLTGAIAICGLPPFNGFLSEFMIFYGGFRAILHIGSLSALPAIIAMISMAMIGGLAVLAFTKAFGIVFLGEPRTSEAAQAHESGVGMIWPMMILAGLCLVVGLSAPLVLSILAPVISGTTDLDQSSFQMIANHLQTPLKMTFIVSLVFSGLIVLFVWIRYLRLKGKVIASSLTWDCGYAAPASTMQYTAASYSQPLTALSVGAILFRRSIEKPAGYFPISGSYRLEVIDFIEHRIWHPCFEAVEWLLLRFRWLQTGSIHLYILYITGTLIALLIWKLW